MHVCACACACVSSMCACLCMCECLYVFGGVSVRGDVILKGQCARKGAFAELLAGRCQASVIVKLFALQLPTAPSSS